MLTNNTNYVVSVALRNMEKEGEGKLIVEMEVPALTSIFISVLGNHL